MIKIGNNLAALMRKGLVQQKAVPAGKVQTGKALKEMMQQPPKKEGSK